MAVKEFTIEEIAEQVIKDMNLTRLLDNDQGRAIIATVMNKALTDLEARFASQLEEERKLRTAAEEGLAELSAKFERRAQFDSDFGFHRGIDGKIKPNVSKRTAETMFNLVRALHQKDMEAVRAVSTGVGAEGGYLVATEIATEVLRLIPEMGLYPSIAREMPLGTGKLDIGSVLSQMGAYWPGENNAITESFPAFGKLSLEGKLCGALIPIPLALINNATPAMGQLFTDLIREAIMKEIDRVFLVGRSVASGGSDTFDGIVNAGSINVLALPSGKTKISDVDADFFLTMQTTVPEGARSDCAYLMEETLLDNIRKVKTSTGDYVNGHYYTPPTGSEPAKLWGKPVFTTSRMPAYSTAAQPSKRFATYGNYKQWAIYGNNQDLAIATSETAGDAFKNCQLLIRGITTVGGAAFGPALAVAETASS